MLKHLFDFTYSTCRITFEYKYIRRDRNVSSAAGMIEHAARMISII